MMHKTQIYLSQAQYHFIRDLARKERRTLADILRELIDQARSKKVEATKDPLWKFIGKG